MVTPVLHRDLSVGKRAGRYVSGKHIECFARVIAELMKKPRTAIDLREGAEITSKDQPYRYLSALRAEGLVYISEWTKVNGRGNYTAVYAWQPSVCQYSDAAKPGVAI